MCLYLQSQYGNGALAERLGTGLQNLLQRFDSARHLTKMLSRYLEGIFRFQSDPKSDHIVAAISNSFQIQPFSYP